jgi:hypothetical protein
MLPPQFDYSEVQWKTIEESAPGLDRSLTQSVRQEILLAARDYLSEIEAKKVRRNKTSQEENDWDAIQRQASKLHQRMLIERDKTADCVRKEYITEAVAYADLLENLTSRLSGQKTNSHEKQNPRLLYQSKILRLWVKLGGELKFSRNTKTKKIQGPLPRFFFAVVTPVMAEATPSPESVPDIVGREKKAQRQSSSEASAKGWFNVRSLVSRFRSLHDGLVERLEAENRDQARRIEMLRSEIASMQHGEPKVEQ